MRSRDKILKNLKSFQADKQLIIKTDFKPVNNPIEEFTQNSKLAGAKVSLVSKEQLDEKLLELTSFCEDFFIYESSLGVCENGALWCHNLQNDRKKLFLSNDLIITIKKENLVANMHQAYEKISFSNKAFGTFISGPSKTADIEQALVLGAHGAMGLYIVIVE